MIKEYFKKSLMSISHGIKKFKYTEENKILHLRENRQAVNTKARTTYPNTGNMQKQGFLAKEMDGRFCT